MIILDSILTSIKKLLGIEEDYEHFDVDVILHINTVFSTLNQLGIGPLEGFSIEDKTATWDMFLEDNKTLNMVKSYMYQRVRLMFDPPQNSFLVQSLEKQILEFEWRICLKEKVG